VSINYVDQSQRANHYTTPPIMTCFPVQVFSCTRTQLYIPRKVVQELGMNFIKI